MKKKLLWFALAAAVVWYMTRPRRAPSGRQESAAGNFAGGPSVNDFA